MSAKRKSRTKPKKIKTPHHPNANFFYANVIALMANAESQSHLGVAITLGKNFQDLISIISDAVDSVGALEPDNMRKLLNFCEVMLWYGRWQNRGAEVAPLVEFLGANMAKVPLRSVKKVENMNAFLREIQSCDIPALARRSRSPSYVEALQAGRQLLVLDVGAEATLAVAHLARTLPKDDPAMRDLFQKALATAASAERLKDCQVHLVGDNQAGLALGFAVNLSKQVYVVAPSA